MARALELVAAYPQQALAAYTLACLIIGIVGLLVGLAALDGARPRRRTYRRR